MDKKNIAVFGSTGSIGIQALEVIATHPDKFSVQALTARQNSDLLIRQALRFRPEVVVIEKEDRFHEVKEVLSDRGIRSASIIISSGFPSKVVPP